MDRIAKAQRKVNSRGLVVVREWLNGFIVCPSSACNQVKAIANEVASASAWDVDASNKLLAAGGFFLPAISIGIK